MSEEKIEQIKKDYMDGQKYKDIEIKHNITRSQLIWTIQSNKWKRKSNRSKIQKGNQNAKGNRGGKGTPKGEKRALKTGEYETIFDNVLTEEEKQIYNNYKIEDKKQILLEEFRILTIREKRMLTRIKKLQDTKKDMTISKLNKTDYKTTSSMEEDSITTHTEAESIIDAIQRIEDALTRVQEAKRRCLETLHKIEIDESKLDIELLKIEIETSRENLQNKEPEATDNSLIDALNLSAKEVWTNEESE